MSCPISLKSPTPTKGIVRSSQSKWCSPRHVGIVYNLYNEKEASPKKNKRTKATLVSWSRNIETPSARLPVLDSSDAGLTRPVSLSRHIKPKGKTPPPPS